MLSSCMIYNMKEIMIYVRNNVNNNDLYNIVSGLQKAISDGDNKILLEIKKQHLFGWDVSIEECSTEVVFNESDYYSKYDKLLFKFVDVLVNATIQRNNLLVYDISDMLQAFPDLKYWKVSKKMRKVQKSIHSYWKYCVCPVISKWKLEELNVYKPTYFDKM